MRDNHNQETTQDNTAPLAIGVPIREAQTGSAGDAHGMPDAVALNAHTGGSANPGVANTVNTIAPTPPVGAVAESHQ